MLSLNASLGFSEESFMVRSSLKVFRLERREDAGWWRITVDLAISAGNPID